MKCGSQIAVAVVGGYILGRSRRTRLAAVLALMAAGGGRLPVGPEDLLRKGPLAGPLDKLTGDLRSQLVDAGMSVAKRAASSRIDALSDRLQERADTLRGTARQAEEAVEEEEEEVPRPRRRREEPPRREREREREEPRRGRAREREYDEYDYDEYDEYERDDYGRDEYGPDEYDEEEPERPRRARRAPARSARPEPRRRIPRREDDRSRGGRSPR